MQVEPQAVTRVRPQRFVSYTMELEPYSYKKAYAFQVFNQVNQQIAERECIHKIFTVHSSVVILTAKQLICVTDIKGRGTEHWVVPFTDIFKAIIRVFDRERMQFVDMERLSRQVLSNLRQSGMVPPHA